MYSGRQLHIATVYIKPTYLEEFLAHFEIEANTQTGTVNDLAAVDRYLLSIYRYAVLKPKVLLVENPSMGMDIPSQHKIWSYLKELSRQEIVVFVNSPNFDALYSGCSKIVSSHSALIECVTSGKMMKNRTKN